MTTLSLSKDKIRFVLLEGIHGAAVEALAEQGYRNVERLSHTLDGADLKDALGNTHFLGIRSRTQVTADALAAAPRLNAIGCFCIGTNQVDVHTAEARGVPVFNPLHLRHLISLHHARPTSCARSTRSTSASRGALMP